MNLTQFVSKWSQATLTERAAAQSHFNDLCEVLDVPRPAEADPNGEWYAFEKGVIKTSGGQGFADVWRRAHFAWEYKGKKKSLTDAYAQLLQYAEALENPPLLVVCDLNRFEVHTRFTGMIKTVYAFDLNALGANQPTPDCPLPPLDVLRALFEQPERLRPRETTEEAVEFGKIAEHLRARKIDPKDAARFLIRLLFCLFAEAARRLVTLRDNWLNPPGASEADLKKRTLTNLYNARPAWLDNAHAALDRAVFAAYGWPDTLTDAEVLERLLALNLTRSGAA